MPRRNPPAPALAPQQPHMQADLQVNQAELIAYKNELKDHLNGSLLILEFGLLCSHLMDFLLKKDSAALCVTVDFFALSASLIYRYGPPLSSTPRNFLLISSSLLVSISFSVALIAEKIKLSRIIIPLVENYGLDTLARYALLLLAGLFLCRQFNILKAGPHQPNALAARPA